MKLTKWGLASLIAAHFADALATMRGLATGHFYEAGLLMAPVVDRVGIVGLWFVKAIALGFMIWIVHGVAREHGDATAAITAHVAAAFSWAIAGFTIGAVVTAVMM